MQFLKSQKMQFPNRMSKKYLFSSCCVISHVSNKNQPDENYGFDKMSSVQLMRNICYIYSSFMLTYVSHMQNK